MQTILPYSRDCTSARSLPLSVLSLLQIPAIPPTTEKNPQPAHQRLETRKSLPNLLPSWIPLSCCLRRVTTTRRTRRQGRHPPGRRTLPAAAIDGKWADAGSRAMRLFIYVVAHCAVRLAHAAVISLRECGIVFRVPADARNDRR